MRGHQRILFATLACGLTLAAGCGGGSSPTETSETVVKSQASARSDWEKAKVEGKAKGSGSAQPIGRSGYPTGH